MLHAAFAHRIRSVPHICLATLETSVIVKVGAYLVVMFSVDQIANRDGCTLRKEPRLEEYI